MDYKMRFGKDVDRRDRARIDEVMRQVADAGEVCLDKSLVQRLMNTFAVREEVVVADLNVRSGSLAQFSQR